MLKEIQLDPMANAPVTISSDAELEEVRRILLSKDQAEIQALKARLDQITSLTPHSLSETLPDGVIQRSQKDDRLVKSMVPVVEETIRASIQLNRTKLADILFPAIGPAIRRAITEALRALLEPPSVQNKYRSWFSLTGLKWRWEAFRTKRSFNEVLLTHTLLYRVEQVFLIHRETGILLNHLVADGVPQQDADLVSGMLTAIKSFVADSFGIEERDGLETLEVGDMTILVQEGPSAVLAGVIRGNPPADLRSVFLEALENIHFEQQVAFENFKGDTKPFLTSTHNLDRCLQASYKKTAADAPAKHYQKLAIKGFLILALFAVPAFFLIRDAWRWSNLVSQLKATSGYVITESSKDWFTAFGFGKYHLRGMRDPLAASVKDIATSHQLNALQIDAPLHPYQSLETAILEKRLQNSLQRSRFTQLSIPENGVVALKGTASSAWMHEAKKLIPAFTGMSALDTTALLSPKQFIEQKLTPKINSQSIAFAFGKSDLDPQSLNIVAQYVRDVMEVSKMNNLPLQIEIQGYADATGTESANQALSQRRADNVRNALINTHRFPAAMLKAVGKGTGLENGEIASAQNTKRMASFHVLFLD